MILGSRVVGRLCEALKIDIRHVKGVVIRAYANDILEIEITRFVTEAETEAVATILEDYRAIKVADHPESPADMTEPAKEAPTDAEAQGD